jgi:hypothetical protein
MKTLIQKLVSMCKRKKPTYGWSIFAQDDSIHLTRRMIEAQRKQFQKLF